MAKIKFNMNQPSVVSCDVQIDGFIEKPGEYNLQIVKAVKVDSRYKADGSEKTYSAEFKPRYVDSISEVYFLSKDLLSGKLHEHYMPLGAFMKAKDFSDEDIADNKIIIDKRDKYAMLTDKDGHLHRIPAAAGSDSANTIRDNFSRLVKALGLYNEDDPITPDDCAQFVGRFFKVKLEQSSFTSNQGKEKTRLNINNFSYRSLSEEDVEQIKELSSSYSAF